MPNSTRSNKKNQLLFPSDPASWERSIRKGRRSSSIDNNTSSSLDSRQPPSTQTPVSSTDTRSPPSSEDTLPSTEDTLPSTDIFHPTLIDTSVRTSINTEPRDMVATLILVRDENGDLHDQEGHLRNAAVQFYTNRSAIRPLTIQIGDFELKPQYYTLVGQTPYYGLSHEHPMDHLERFEDLISAIQARAEDLKSKIATFTQVSTESFRSSWIRFKSYQRDCPHHGFNEVQLLSVFFRGIAARHPHPPSPVYFKIDRQTGPAIDRQRETAIDRQPPAPIDRHEPLTYRVQMPKIDVARLNSLRPQPKPSANPPKSTSTHSDDATEPLEVDKAPLGRTLRKIKEKVAKHLKREAKRRRWKVSKREYSGFH
ncbi:hypothetical protein Bca4012_005995 [Brassica carinata]